MADCSKNNNFSLLNGGTQIRNIKFNTDRTEMQLIDIVNASVECTRNINSGSFLGVKIVNNNLVFTDAIQGLNTSMTMLVADNPTIKIAAAGIGVLAIIGIDEINNGFTVPQMNVRYDAATNSVKFQI
ncbi:MAG: hypothetical protein IPN76_07310 [Saprospiraceae bacterium]|jgi:hypothetical protein|nr:hypothetical protein [Saprospiraceae bacterium]